MAEKSPNSSIQLLIHRMTRSVMFMAALIFLAMVIVFIIDDSIVSTAMEVWSSPRDFLSQKVTSFNNTLSLNTSIDTPNTTDIPSLAPEISLTNLSSNNRKIINPSNIENPVENLGKQEHNLTGNSADIPSIAPEISPSNVSSNNHNAIYHSNVENPVDNLDKPEQNLTGNTAEIPSFAPEISAINISFNNLNVVIPSNIENPVENLDKQVQNVTGNTADIPSLAPEISPTNMSSDNHNNVSSSNIENPVENLENLEQNKTLNTSYIPSMSPKISPSNVISDNHNNVLTSNIENPVENLETADKNVTWLNENPDKDNGLPDLEWDTVELEPNYSSNLLAKWLSPGGDPCKDSRTVEIKFLTLDDTKPIILPTGYPHQIDFQALDELGNPHCQGGDYFEIDLSGEFWKSRPPIRDLGNGTYSFTLQVHPDFAGNYTMMIILLFRHFEGLSLSPTRFAFDKQLRKIPITFSRSEAKLPNLSTCKRSDFTRGLWAGRWTRLAKNDGCEISDDGRFRCLDANHPCTLPWCSGSLDLLESNGWVYSAHCSFKLFSIQDSWNCLNHRWLFFWGDSNHVDTTRNILFFFLGLPVQPVTRRFDMNLTNPRDDSQWVRITSIFNGHWDDKSNYLGLKSLSNKGYRDLLKGYFSKSVIPDTVIFNSGLHDGVHWPNIRWFVNGADYAAKFWAEVIEGAKKRGLNVPNFIFRSTITAGGYARTLAFNPNKIEAFNKVLIEKLREVGIVTGIIDDFDMTWAWHFDNRCNDGVHYGRFPAKLKWRDGQIGHQYFVDLMLGHVLLNAICGQ